MSVKGLRLSQLNTRQRALIVAAPLLIGLLGFLIGQVFRGPADHSEVLFEGRNFVYTPFELVDAYQLCKYTAQQEHGEQLLRLYTDDLSTHFNTKEQRYIVVLNAQVGDPREYDDVRVFCTINPFEHRIDYYREVNENEVGLIGRALNFFKGDR